MPPRCPPELMEREELIEELLLRFPPDDPASLVRAALVSKRWCRLLCGRSFRRRFREFHGTPPLLGLVRQGGGGRAALERASFVPSSSFHPRDHADDRRSFRAVHSCHGRVLLQAADPTATAYSFSGVIPQDLFVWVPVTGMLRKLPEGPLDAFVADWNAAVLCGGAAAGGGGCDHLDCNDDGPFMVVFVGNLVYDFIAAVDDVAQTFTCVYSSEDDSWSEPMPVHTVPRNSRFDEGNAVLVENAVYFMCRSITPAGRPATAILKYDLVTREASPIRIPRVGILEHIHDKDTVSLLMAREDGRLGFAFTLFTSTKPRLYLWSREHGPDGDAGWAQSRVMDLDKLLQTSTEISSSIRVVAFADTGAGGVIFIWTGDGLFSLNLKSGSSKVIEGSFGDGRVVPYVSFCTPALGAVSIDEAPGGSEPSA